MCRYGTFYKPHFACFACRKSFKRRIPEDIKHHGPLKPAKCPQCGEEMADMGHDFKPPKMKDVKAWRVLESLWTIGETFHSCGCGGPGYRPRDKKAFLAYLVTMEERYMKQLKQALASNNSDRGEAVEFWKERMARLEEAAKRIRA